MRIYESTNLRILLSLLLCAFSYGPAMADSPLAARNALEQKVRTYHAQKDCKAMAGLFYTQGIDKARRKVLAKTVGDYLCANFGRAIGSIAFQAVDPARQKQPSDFGGTPSAFTLAPEGAMVIDYGRGKATDAKALTFLYGTHGDKAYLITTRNADAD